MSSPGTAGYESVSQRHGFNGNVTGGSGIAAPPGGAAPSAAQAAEAVQQAVAQAAQGTHVLFAKVVDRASGRPVKNARCQIVGPGDAVLAEVVTAYDGIVRREFPQPGSYHVKVVEVGDQ